MAKSKKAAAPVAEQTQEAPASVEPAVEQTAEQETTPVVEPKAKVKEMPKQLVNTATKRIKRDGRLIDVRTLADGTVSETYIR